MASQMNRHRPINTHGVIALAVNNVGISGAIPRQATHFIMYVAETTVGLNIEFFTDAGLTNKVFRTGTNGAAGNTIIPIPREAQYYRFQLYAAGSATFTGTWVECMEEE